MTAAGVTRLRRVGAAAFWLWAQTLVAAADTISYRAELNGAEELPPSDSSATGKVDARFDTESLRLSYTLTYSGLSGPVLGAHLHRAEEPGATGGMVAEIHGSLASPIRGEVELTPAEAADLEKGLVYLNIHTRLHPAGEIRGQLRKRPRPPDSVQPDRHRDWSSQHGGAPPAQ